MHELTQWAWLWPSYNSYGLAREQWEDRDLDWRLRSEGILTWHRDQDGISGIEIPKRTARSFWAAVGRTTKIETALLSPGKRRTWRRCSLGLKRCSCRAYRWLAERFGEEREGRVVNNVSGDSEKLDLEATRINNLFYLTKNARNTF